MWLYSCRNEKQKNDGQAAGMDRRWGFIGAGSALILAALVASQSDFSARFRTGTAAPEPPAPAVTATLPAAPAAPPPAVAEAAPAASTAADAEIARLTAELAARRGRERPPPHHARGARRGDAVAAGHRRRPRVPDRRPRSGAGRQRRRAEVARSELAAIRAAAGPAEPTAALPAPVLSAETPIAPDAPMGPPASTLRSPRSRASPAPAPRASKPAREDAADLDAIFAAAAPAGVPPLPSRRPARRWSRSTSTSPAPG